VSRLGIELAAFFLTAAVVLDGVVIGRVNHRGDEKVRKDFQIIVRDYDPDF